MPAAIAASPDFQRTLPTKSASPAKFVKESRLIEQKNRYQKNHSKGNRAQRTYTVV
jgi:hypothetical protein